MRPWPVVSIKEESIMMAYRKNFVVAIKHKGRILRELDEAVKLPFGAEYSILLKNKDSRRAVASVEVDGKDVVDGKSLIVEPKTSIELKGFMKGTTVRNKFRFIKKTKRISEYRGDTIDDGLVSVEFWFEREQDLKITPSPSPWPPVYGGNWDTNVYTANTCNLSASQRLGAANVSSNITHGTFSTPCKNNNKVKGKEDDNGITVKGAETNQNFTYGHTNTLESTSSVITLRLSGFSKRTGKKVKKALSVNARIPCSTCGLKSRSSAKFCPGCGTYLH